MPLFGAHMSVAGGLHTGFERGIQSGCDAIQIFTKSNRQWGAKPITVEDEAKFKQAAAESGLPVASHATYLINLASPKDEIWDKSVAAYIDEMNRCRQLGIPYLVLHPGAHTGSSFEAGFKRVAEAINREIESGDDSAMLLLEITAGTGTTLGFDFSHFRDIFALVHQPERVGVCFDTCHAIGAGYDLTTREGYEQTFQEFDEKIGLDKLRYFHLNDSHNPVGSRRDRHTHIGLGCCTLEAFRFLANDPRFANHPMILETPKDEDMAQDKVNMRILRALIEGADEQITAETIESFWEGISKTEGKDE
jgi:deoxyribonuclease-4